MNLFLLVYSVIIIPLFSYFCGNMAVGITTLQYFCLSATHTHRVSPTLPPNLPLIMSSDIMAESAVIVMVYSLYICLICQRLCIVFLVSFCAVLLFTYRKNLCLQPPRVISPRIQSSSSLRLKMPCLVFQYLKKYLALAWLRWITSSWGHLLPLSLLIYIQYVWPFNHGWLRSMWQISFELLDVLTELHGCVVLW